MCPGASLSQCVKARPPLCEHACLHRSKSRLTVHNPFLGSNEGGKALKTRPQSRKPDKGMLRLDHVMSLTQSLTCVFLAFSLGNYSVRAEQTSSRTSAADIANSQPALAVPASELERRLSIRGASPAEQAELDALKSFYADRQNEPVWITRTGYTAAANLIRVEIGQANEWGLEASAFRTTPVVARENLNDVERADAEIELSLAILQYARFARGGRTEPLALSRNLDRTTSLLNPRKGYRGRSC